MNVRTNRALQSIVLACFFSTLWPVSEAQSDRSQRPDSRPSPGGQSGGNRPGPGDSGGRPQPSRPGPGQGSGRPNPGGGGPSRPQPQPPRPSPGGPSPGRPNPGRPNPGQRPPPRPGRPPQWGRPPQNRPNYQFRPNNRDYLRRYYLSHLRYVNRARRPVFTIGGYFPLGDIGYLTPVPASLYGQLPPPPPGYQMGYFDGYVVVYDPTTYFIANLVDLLQ